jgi:cathepsin B
LCLLAFVALTYARPELNEFEHQAHIIVQKVNSANAGWTAEAYPRFAKMTPEERKALLGLKVPEKLGFEHKDATRPETPILGDDEIPEEFDPSKKWPECADVINSIRDQSRCGDCWAVAAAGCLSDRICIQSGGKVKESASDIDTASCAQKGHDGCQGASDLSPSWIYYHKNGVVTGGKYESEEGCKPYPYPLSRDATRDYATPRCSNRCDNRSYNKTYVQDKIFTDEPIVLHGRSPKKVVELIQREIMARGSVEVGFIVYSDFMYYRSGVYKHTWGSVEGGHAVRCVGWGVENGKPYWLIANSWNDDWGVKGFFKISRGTDEAYIESMTDPYAGKPILN